MGGIFPFNPEKLICGVLISREIDLDRVLVLLESRLGSVDHVSSVLDFSYTSYYEAEMGMGIRRVYLSFRDMVSPRELPEIKIRTNSLEETFLKEGRRLVNIDPGLLSLTRVILASTKDAGHRIPLSDGIYGEVTLIYRFGQWQPLEWTYPDYKSDECREQMFLIREIYKKQRKSTLFAESDNSAEAE